jgi:Ca2+-dependent lipid-binding protein
MATQVVGANLTIGIVCAKDLMSADSNGLSDPFVDIVDKNSGKKTKVKTKTIYKSLNPTWSETFSFSYPNLAPEQLTFKLNILDFDRIGGTFNKLYL